jgi:hypothetical protein
MTYGIFLVTDSDIDSAIYIGMYGCETVEESKAEENRLNKDCRSILKHTGCEFKLWQQ